VQAALLGSRAALTRLKGMAAAGSHTWLRLALISGDKSAAALFDDLSLAGVARGNTKRNTIGGSTNAQWVATIQAAGGLVRTNIPMKNTILRIALTNKKQVGSAAGSRWRSMPGCCVVGVSSLSSSLLFLGGTRRRTCSCVSSSSLSLSWSLLFTGRGRAGGRAHVALPQGLLHEHQTAACFGPASQCQTQRCALRVTNNCCRR
jgi:hypothetical protein